VTLTN